MPRKTDRCRTDEKKKVIILNTKETQSAEERTAVRTFLLSKGFAERKKDTAR